MKAKNIVNHYLYLVLISLFLSSCAQNQPETLDVNYLSGIDDPKVALVKHSIYLLVENEKEKFKHNIVADSDLNNYGIQTFLATCFKKINQDTIRIESIKRDSVKNISSVYAYFDNDKRSMIEAIVTEDQINGNLKLLDIVLQNEYFDYWGKIEI